MSSEAFAMKNKGQYSYALQSTVQKQGSDLVMTMINKEIQENISIKQLSSSSSLFTLADLGCSIGPNTFSAMHNIVEAIEAKYQSEALDPENLEFQVFFNDQVFNDFNALFKSLPSQRRYYASGVPGSFYGRLFPKASLHFVYSTYALHWLSMVPKEVVDKASPTWNKSRISYGSKEVEEAFLAQYMKDMECFLTARAKELIPGGIMALLVLGIPDDTDPSKCKVNAFFAQLGSALMDMANLGLVDEAMVDSFNLPWYITSSKGLKDAIERNGCFTIHRIEPLVHSIPTSVEDIQKLVNCIRSTIEEPLTKCFGSEVIDELFDRFTKRTIESRILQDASYAPGVDYFVLLARVSED